MTPGWSANRKLSRNGVVGSERMFWTYCWQLGSYPRKLSPSRRGKAFSESANRRRVHSHEQRGKESKTWRPSCRDGVLSLASNWQGVSVAQFPKVQLRGLSAHLRCGIASECPVNLQQSRYASPPALATADLLASPVPSISASIFRAS